MADRDDKRVAPEKKLNYSYSWPVPNRDPRSGQGDFKQPQNNPPAKIVEQDAFKGRIRKSKV